MAAKVLLEEFPNMAKEELQSMLANVLKAAARQWFDIGSVCTEQILAFSAGKVIFFSLSEGFTPCRHLSHHIQGDNVQFGKV